MTSYTFTKLVVEDLDAMYRFYSEAYGFESVGRLSLQIGSEPVEEIMLGRDGEHAGLILLTFLERPAPASGEVILGLTTPDLDGLLHKVVAAGGVVQVPAFTSKAAGVIQFAFVTDPEGHLTELVQMA